MSQVKTNTYTPEIVELIQTMYDHGEKIDTIVNTVWERYGMRPAANTVKRYINDYVQTKKTIVENTLANVAIDKIDTDLHYANEAIERFHTTYLECLENRQYVVATKLAHSMKDFQEFRLQFMKGEARLDDMPSAERVFEKLLGKINK